MLILTLLALLLWNDDCRRCESTGVVPCKRHGEWLEAEGEVLFCSHAAACKDCGGTLVVDCKRCEGGPGSAAAEKRAGLVQAWMEPTAVEERIGRSVLRVETDRFHLVVETGKVREGRKKIDPHELLHRIARDVEAVARALDADFGAEPEDYASKMRMWIWKEPGDHQEVMRHFLGSASTGDFKMLGRDPRFSVWTEPGLFDTVLGIRTLFAHNAGHMLLSNLERELWIGDLGGGWLDAAVGHHYEYALFDRTVNHCIEEATLEEPYANGQWRAAIRKRLAKESEPQLPRLFQLNTGALAQRDQALCWSFFDFLRATEPESLRPILNDLKAKRPLRDILRQRLGQGAIALDAAWRQWVAEIYPVKGDKPRTPK